MFKGALEVLCGGLLRVWSVSGLCVAVHLKDQGGRGGKWVGYQ